MRVDYLAGCRSTWRTGDPCSPYLSSITWTTLWPLGTGRSIFRTLRGTRIRRRTGASYKHKPTRGLPGCHTPHGQRPGLSWLAFRFHYTWARWQDTIVTLDVLRRKGPVAGGVRSHSSRV